MTRRTDCAEVFVAPPPSSPIFQLAPTNQQSLGADVHSHSEAGEFWLPHSIVFERQQNNFPLGWLPSYVLVSVTLRVRRDSNLSCLRNFAQGSHWLH